MRLALLVVMLASLVMSAALPEAFSDRGLLFACAYLAIQGGRSVFAVAVLRAEPRLRRDVQRIQSWLMASATLWLAGGLTHGTARELLWLAAVVLDLGAPACRFYVPRLGRSQTTDWTVTGAHLAERFQLFLMIALGESILVTGVTFGQLPWSPARLTALVVAFGGSAALWWIYFNRSAEDGRAVIARSADPGRLGRVAYTYLHLPMVAGIIVTAVGDDLIITDPHGQADAATIATVLRPGTVPGRACPVQAGAVGRAVGRPPGRHRRVGCPGAARFGRVVTRAGHHGDAGAGGGGRMGRANPAPTCAHDAPAWPIAESRWP